MISSLFIIAAAVTVNFDKEIGKVRPELHSSGFGPQICSCPQESMDAIKSMGFNASRTHDWALINPNQRVCDYFHMFPLMKLDAKNPENYVFGPTDYLLKRTREEMGHDIFFRLGTSIEHSGPKVHFNALIPEDFDKVAEIFAGTIRHYNRGWANGFNWGIKYWEIWNEPDGNNTMWCLPDGDLGVGETEDERKADMAARTLKRRDLFVRFFVTCLKRLKGEFPDIKVGGPALCRMKPDYFTAILKACKEAGVAPDFISWHHYTSKPDVIMNAIVDARKLCDELGFKNCELIIDEWHYLPPQGWAGIRSADPDVQKEVWSGPASHNGIDSSCFNLTVLSRMQTSALGQNYYYGCRNTGWWGFMDECKRKYKVYYGLKLFGDLIRQRSLICESSGAKDVTVFAVKGADGGRKAVLVTDYRSGSAEDISVEVDGVPADAKVSAWVHDYTRDFESIPVKFEGGKVLIKKADANSAAYLVTFVQPLQGQGNTIFQNHVGTGPGSGL